MSVDFKPWNCLTENYWTADAKDQWCVNSNQTRFMTAVGDHPQYGKICCDIEKINEWEFSWKVSVLHRLKGYYETDFEISGLTGTFSEAKTRCDFYFCETTPERRSA